MTGPPIESAATTRRRKESSKTEGWDQPPAVASPAIDESWTPRPCHWRTPQRLFALDPHPQQLAKDFAWGNLLCAPIVISKKYILVASDTQLLLYGKFDSQPQLGTKSISPLTKFSLDATDDGESFGDDKILQISFHEDTSIVYAVTVESIVYQIKVVLDDKDTPPTFQMMHTWITRQLGATCMETHSNAPENGFDIICVGYRSGHIEGWKVPQVYKEDPKRKRMPPRKTSKDVILEWGGFLYDSVRTLSFLPNDESDELLLMAVVSVVTIEKGVEQPTSSMLKILDVKQIAVEKSRQESTITTASDNTSLSLEHYSVAPSRGMELVDASTVSLSKDPCLPKRVPVLDGQRSNAACNFSVGDKQFSSLAFSDGTIGLFSRNKDYLGIAKADHQILLSYPAIGSGHIMLANDDSNKNDKSSCLAVCLRGGTCYLIPVSINNNDDNSSIVAIPFPHDIEMDLSDVYVQAFTAGNLVVDGIDLPVLIYAWPGGVMDVYSCGLVSANSKVVLPKQDEIFVSRAQKRCLRDLIDNEAISLVTQILEESRENNPLLQASDWKELLEAIDAGTISLGQEIPLESLLSKEYQSLRNVLLSLALVNE